MRGDQSIISTWFVICIKYYDRTEKGISKAPMSFHTSFRGNGGLDDPAPEFFRTRLVACIILYSKIESYSEFSR